MADKLIFPIGFDLEAAVKQAQGDADRLLRKLETTIKSRPLAINLKIDNAGVGSINEINKRMGELVKQWNSLTEAERIHNKTSGEYTPQAQKIIKEYVRLTGATESYARTLQKLAAAARRSANEQEKNVEKQRELEATLKASENSIANVTAKLQHYKKEMNSANVGSSQFSKAAAEVKRLTERLSELQAKVQTATGIAKKEVNSVTQELEKQDGYVANLIKKMAVYASFSAVGTLLTRVREVTAEFELQRVSLGAIIQDQQRANELFSEIKAFALKSPLKILDLTKYTKQVAAYRIEQDKLFDTTKRLADVSVGLGVDMGRIVLAYGQVKAASYLRAAEIRQFTEAGIPMLELLAEKFTELSGTAVSTEEVMDKVSKRMVAFSMVEEIFEDMTSAGGMFYNMQEKQSQTLYGMWAKMGDAAAVMYEQMGNTAVVNGAMKGIIQLMSDMMLHWTALANVAQTAIIGFGLYKAAMAGLVPGFDLVYKKILNQTMAEKRKQAVMVETMSIGRAYTLEEARSVATKNQLIAADYKKILTENKFSAAKLVGMARQAAYNAELRKAIIELDFFSNRQIAALRKMNGWQFFFAKLNAQIGFFTKRQIVQWNALGGGIKGWWGKIKLIGTGIKQVAATAGEAIGGMVAAYAPLLGLTAVIDLFMDWRNAVAAQEEAVKKVDKQYEEMKVSLMEIKNAYDDIKKATREAGVSEDEFIKTSYSQKLEQLKKVIKLLGNFGMKNVIDPSVLNYTNIDPVLDKWLAKLNEVNELARGWGREVALVANAYEGNIFGWSIFGENLKEDMKDLERSWTKLTVNSNFNQSLSQLRAIVGDLANDNKEVYNNISKAIGADLKLALGQKRRNESELQYQQRIYKNYQNIESLLQTYLKKGEYKGMLPSLSSADVGDVVADFQKDVDEVMHEFDKVKEKFRDQDALSVKMAIDTIAAENDWTDWQKELLIQHLNEDPITLNAEIIPTTNVAGQGLVAEGLKAIITSEFPTLFNENELQSLVSAEGIVDAIKAKLDASNESLEKTMQLQNNLAYGSKGFENSLERVKKLQKEISDIEDMRTELQQLKDIEGEKTDEQLLRQSELEAKLQEVDETSLNTKRAQIAAIVEANAKYDEQIQKQRESAEAEREIAKAALERVTSMGLSDLGKDVKNQFEGLMVDAVKEITDKNYSTDFLISDEELKKIRDVGDLYEVWAKNTKAIKDEKEKLVGVGITEATIEKERAELETKRAKVQSDLADLERQMTDDKYAAQVAEYNRLRYALTTAVTQEAQQKAQKDLNKFLGDTQNAEFAILMMKKEGLRTTLQETLVSEQANTQIADYLKGLEDADKLWEELGKRYNFKLPTKDRGRGGSGEDPWILLMKNRMKFMQDFQKGVEDLSKWMGYTKGLADEQENMLGRGLSLKIDSRELDGSKEELIKWYEDAIEQIRSKIAKMGGKEWEGLGVQMILAKDTKNRVLKKYQELLADMFKELTDFRTEQTQKELETKIKQLADRISRTKTAKEFYEKILSQTGEVELAAKLSVSVYGDTGQNLQREIATQLSNALKGVTADGQMIGANVFEEGVIDPNTFYVNYAKLREIVEKQGGKLSDSQKKILDDMLKNGEAYNKSQVEQWAKDLAKVKDFTDQYIDLYRMTEQRKAEIRAKMKSGELDEDAGKQEIAGYDARLVKEQSKIQYEMFKNSPMYTALFENMENATVQSLHNMRSQIETMMAVTKEPTQLKELQNRLNDIDATLAEKSPFEVIAKGWQTMGEMAKKYGSRSNLDNLIKQKQAELDALQAELDAALEKEAQAKQFAEMAGVDVQNPATAITPAQKAALAAYQQASANVERYGNAVKKADKEQQELTSDATKWANAMEKVKKGLKTIVQIGSKLLEASEAAQEFAEALGMSEDGLELFQDINNVISNTLNFADALIGCIDLMAKTTAQSISTVEKASVILTVISAALQIATAIFNMFSNSKVRKANKEIERQQELLERLEYTYKRLQNAADKLFGRDYISNYNQQIKVLEAQQTAYLKQAQAERSKGKKADKDKIKEYENAARDTADEIKKMQADLTAHFTGSTRTDAAREFVQSWIEAKATFASTTDAIKSKYSEMIKSMIIEGAAARVIDNALTPLWNQMDALLANNNTTGAIDYLIQGMDSFISAADNGMNILWKSLEAKGYDMHKLLGDSSTNLTGISRDIATASEEDINGLAAHMNTVEFYVAMIQRDVATMAQGGVASSPTSSTDYTPMIQQSLENQNAMIRYQSETLTECKKIAAQCKAQTDLISKVIVPRNHTGGAYKVYVAM